MPDFTIKTYKKLLKDMVRQGFTFQTYASFLKGPLEKVIVLRHDVDLLPANSLTFARIENTMGIRGAYYFRAVPESWNETIIREIAVMGHEIGYHYECLTACKGDIKKAIIDFEKNLEKLRRLAPVETICMHGSPLSKFDSRELWKTYNYRDYGIIGEPYFDTDFSQVLYLTDTGRRWDGEKVSVRDRIEVKSIKLKAYSFHSTYDIIRTAEQGILPDKIMFTFHPQRWTDRPIPWLKELLLQNAKNAVKRVLLISRKQNGK